MIAAEGGTDIADISEVKKMGKQGTEVCLQGIIFGRIPHRRAGCLHIRRIRYVYDTL